MAEAMRKRNVTSMAQVADLAKEVKYKAVAKAIKEVLGVSPQNTEEAVEKAEEAVDAEATRTRNYDLLATPSIPNALRTTPADGHVPMATTVDALQRDSIYTRIMPPDSRYVPAPPPMSYDDSPVLDCPTPGRMTPEAMPDPAPQPSVVQPPPPVAPVLAPAPQPQPSAVQPPPPVAPAPPPPAVDAPALAPAEAMAAEPVSPAMCAPAVTEAPEEAAGNQRWPRTTLRI